MKKADIQKMASDAATPVGRRPTTESKREKAKRLRIAGKSYINSKGQNVPGKTIGPDCNCRLECYKKINEGKRQEIFEQFYALKSYDEQGSYLYGLIRKHDVKRKRALMSDGKFSTYKYHIRCNGKFIQVCKTAFANIHSISFKKIRNLCEKLDHDVLYPHDQRGKHGNRPSKIPAEIVDCIKNFILSVLQSDQLIEFIREDKTHQQCEINVSQLYKQYMKVHEPGAFDTNGMVQPRTNVIPHFIICISVSVVIDKQHTDSLTESLCCLFTWP